MTNKTSEENIELSPLIIESLDPRVIPEVKAFIKQVEAKAIKKRDEELMEKIAYIETNTMTNEFGELMIRYVDVQNQFSKIKQTS